MNAFRQRLTRFSLFTTLALFTLLSLEWYPRPQSNASFYFADEDVRWTNLVNTTATANTIRKTGGANDGSYDGSGVSQQTITNNGFYEFRATGTDAERVTGLTDTPNDKTLTSLDFYVNLSEGGFAEFRERGTYLADTVYVSGDTFRITLVNGRAEFSKNGTVLARSNTTVSTPMYASALFSLLGGEVSAARLGNISGGGSCAAPVVSVGPGTIQICEQAAWSFSASVTSGTGPFTYQWFKGGVAIPGANGSTYGKATSNLSDTGNYVVTVTNACGTTTSGVSFLSVRGLTGISPESTTVPAAGGTGRLLISTGVNANDNSCGYVITALPNWITGRDDSGPKAQGAWAYTVAANTGAARTGVVTISNLARTRSVNFTVNQAAGSSNCTYSLNPATANVAASGSNGTVTINTQAGCAWQVRAVESWILIPGLNSGVGTGTFNYQVLANAGAARTGIIQANGANFTINQAGTGGGSNVQDVIWTNLVNTTATGGTIRKTGGANDGSYDGGGVSSQSFSINGYYEFTAGGADVERVTGLTDTPNNRDFATFDFYVNLSEGGIAEFRERGEYLGDTPYRVGDVFRITVENGRARYSKNGVTLAYGSATTTASLKALAVFSVLNGEVTQAKLGGLTGGCTYAISPTTAQAAAAGATGSVAVTAPGGCTWTASSNANWLTIGSGAAGNGNGTVTYTAGANTGAQRTGTLTIAGQTFTVTQAAVTPSSPDVTWTQLTNVTLFGTTLRKTGGSDDGTYDGHAVSRQVLSGGTGYVEFTVSGPYVRRSIGLSRVFTPGNPSSLEFEINLSDSNVVELRSRGQYIGDGTYRIGDVIRLAVENGRVVLYVNARAVAETTSRPTYPLQVWATFSRLGGEVSGVKLYTGQLPTLQQRRTPTGDTGEDPITNPQSEPPPIENPRQ